MSRSTCSERSAAAPCGASLPSGSAEPSDADEALTYRIKQVFDVIDVRILDHIIVGKTCYSFSEAGLL
jgi:DNA repair protein RadC